MDIHRTGKLFLLEYHKVLFSAPLYNIFTADLVMLYDVKYFLFADDTGFIASDPDPAITIIKSGK